MTERRGLMACRQGLIIIKALHHTTTGPCVTLNSFSHKKNNINAFSIMRVVVFDHDMMGH